MSFEYNFHGHKINSYNFPCNFYIWLPWAFEYSMSFLYNFPSNFGDFNIDKGRKHSEIYNSVHYLLNYYIKYNTDLLQRMEILKQTKPKVIKDISIIEYIYIYILVANPCDAR